MRTNPDLKTEAHTEEVLTMLLNGATQKEIHAHAKKEWGLSLRQVSRLIAAARAAFRKTARVNRREEIGKALARYEDLYRRNIKVQDYKAAAGVNDRIVKLLDLSRQTDAPQTAEDLLKRGKEQGPPEAHPWVT